MSHVVLMTFHMQVVTMLLSKSFLVLRNVEKMRVTDKITAEEEPINNQ